jgi:hypothetical protein
MPTRLVNNLFDKLKEFIKSKPPKSDYAPDYIPDTDIDTVKEMKTKNEEETKTVTLFKIKF